MKAQYDVAVLGGGASGLAAAITVKRKCPSWDIAVFEKKEVFGKKLSATGNGRCNLSNVKCSNMETVMDFFSSCGISTRSDAEGRIYPYSEDAKDVTRALVNTATGLGVELFSNAKVIKVEAIPFMRNHRGGFHILSEENETEIYAENIVLSMGGKSYPAFGTTGDGFIIARSLGHRVSKLIPSLTAIEVSDNIKSLKGLRVKAEAFLYLDSNMIFKERGEVQFREDSVSGICIMNMSQMIKTLKGQSPEDSFRHYQIRLNLIPDFNSRSVKNMMEERLSAKGFDEADAMNSIVKREMSEYIARKGDVFFAGSGGKSVTDEDKAAFFADELSDFRMNVKGLKGWEEAQLTSGGIPLDEVDANTMESLIVPGLFITGEMLDRDGPCGGFNLHNAWLTGIMAGKALAR